MNTKNPSIVKSATIITSSRFLSYAISLVATMLLARFRTLEEYGTYSQILMVVNLVSSIIMLGMPNSLNFFLARANTHEEKTRVLSVYYTINTVLSAVVGLVLVLMVPLIEDYFKNNLISKFSYFICLYPWTKIIKESVENLLVVLKRTGVLVTYRVCHSITVVGCILIVQWLSLTFAHYIALYLISEIVYSFLVYIMASRYGGQLRVSFDKELLKKILVFSVPLGLSVAAGTLNSEIDKFLIGYLFSTEELALYTNAAKELPLTMIAGSFTAVLLPQIAIMIRNNKLGDAINLWKDVTTFSMIINVFFAIGLFVFSEEAVVFLYSEKYIESANVFAVYSLLLIIRSTYFGMILNSTGNTQYILMGSVMTLAINFVLNILFYAMFGFVGPAIATIVCTALNAFYSLYITARITKEKIYNIFPFKDAGRIIGVNIILGALFYAFKTSVPLEMYISSTGEAFFCAFLWMGLDALIFSKDIKRSLTILKTK